MRVYQTWSTPSPTTSPTSHDPPVGRARLPERFVVAQSAGGGNGQIGNGAFVAGVQFGDAEAAWSTAGPPFADAEGMVRTPNIDPAQAR